MDVFSKTQDLLQKYALTNPEILVSFSGGKDSWAVLDLCRHYFKKVTGFFMYFIPGIEFIEKIMDEARNRYHVEILYYPHLLLFSAIKTGVYMPNYYKFDTLPNIKLMDLYAIARHDSGISLIATGIKKTDSLWRRMDLKTTSYSDVLHPILDWNKFDTLAYLKMRGIPIPSGPKGNAGGVDLSMPSLIWLHDTYPDDFKKLLGYFPYAEAVIKRRDYYGPKPIRKI